MCFSLSDNLFDQKLKFYCRISALPAPWKRNRLGPWGFFPEYWIFEVWLPWTIVIKPFMWWSKLFLKSNNADHQDHQNHPPVRGAAGEGTMAGIWPLPAFTCLALQIFVYLDQLNRQFYQYHQYHQDYRYHQDQSAKTAIFGPKTLFLALGRLWPSTINFHVTLTLSLIDIHVYYLKLNRATVHSSQKDFTLERRLFCGWTSFQARLTQSDLRPRSFVSAHLRWHFTFVHLRSFQLSLTYKYSL